MAVEVRRAVMRAYDPGPDPYDPVAIGSMAKRLPTDVFMCNFLPMLGMKGWCIGSGLFSPTASRAAVEKACKLKLQQLGITKSLFQTHRQKMIDHIYDTAISPATDQQLKKEIIQQGSDLYSTMWKEYSYFRKARIKTAEVAGALFGNLIFRTVFATGILLLSLYGFVKALSHKKFENWLFLASYLGTLGMVQMGAPLIVELTSGLSDRVVTVCEGMTRAEFVRRCVHARSAWVELDRQMYNQQKA